MALRKRKNINYNDNSNTEKNVPLHISEIRSTSHWNEIVIEYLKINVSDVSYDEMFDCDKSLFEEAEYLIISDWLDSKWLANIDLNVLNINNKIKTVIGKIKSISIAKNNITETVVDGFMDSLLHILRFDDYPCYLYPQYEYSAVVGYNHKIKAKSDFGIISQESKMLLVVEDKTITNASYTNNWKEPQILGELFVAIHNITSNNMSIKKYPIYIYAIRVVGTIFTFYRAIATLDYIKETSKQLPHNTTMTVQRYPLVKDEPSGLTKYDICKATDRKKILECMCSIQRFMSLP